MNIGLLLTYCVVGLPEVIISVEMQQTKLQRAIELPYDNWFITDLMNHILRVTTKTKTNRFLSHPFGELGPAGGVMYALIYSSFFEAPTLARSSDRNSVRLSVCPSVRHTRA